MFKRPPYRWLFQIPSFALPCSVRLACSPCGKCSHRGWLSAMAGVFGELVFGFGREDIKIEKENHKSRVWRLGAVDGSIPHRGLHGPRASVCVVAARAPYWSFSLRLEAYRDGARSKRPAWTHSAKEQCALWKRSRCFVSIADLWISDFKTPISAVMKSDSP